MPGMPAAPEHPIVTVFPTTEPGETLLDVYTRTFTGFGENPRSTVYLSLPMTGGGAREYVRQQQPDLSPHDLAMQSIRTNAQYADAVVAHTFPVFGAPEVTLPPRIAPRPTFDEIHFNLFWLLYNGGLKPSDAQTFLSYLADNAFDGACFSNFAQSREERLQVYLHLSQLYRDFLADYQCQVNPLAGMVMFPDFAASLGCTLELLTAQILNIPVRKLLFDRKYPGFIQFAEQHAPWLLLDTDSNRDSQIEGDGKQLIVLQSL